MCLLGDGATNMKHSRYPLRYLIVSGLCLLTHNVILIVADAGGLASWLAILLSFGIVATGGYIGHSKFTFDQKLSLSAYFRYSFAMIANVPIVFVLVWFLHDFLGLPMVIGAPLSSVLMLVMNYVLSRWAILRPVQVRAG